MSVKSALVAEAVREYTTMTATRYQHHNVENAVRRTYFYDCVGFVTYALGQSAPEARSTLMTRFAIRKGYVPSPARYVQFFDELDGSQPAWSPVPKVGDLRPGDVVAWAYNNPTRSNGHAFIVAAPPTQDGTDSWLVAAWDSTASPHRRDDTRRTNPKNLPSANGKPSGLGRGTVRLDTNTQGQLTNVRWSPTSGAMLTRGIAGRGTNLLTRRLGRTITAGQPCRTADPRTVAADRERWRSRDGRAMRVPGGLARAISRTPTTARPPPRGGIGRGVVRAGRRGSTIW